MSYSSLPRLACWYSVVMSADSLRLVEQLASDLKSSSCTRIRLLLARSLARIVLIQKRSNGFFLQNGQS